MTLGTALAKKLGVPVELVPHQGLGRNPELGADSRWDVAFLPVDDERKKFVDFGNAYHLLQSTFLVAPGSKIASVKDANAKGMRHRRRRQHRHLPRRQQGDAEGDPYRIRRCRRRGRRHERARSRRSRCRASRFPGWSARFAGARILDDAFLNSSTAVCVPKGKPAALAYVSEFIEEAKASGLVRKALDEMGLTPSQSRRRG